MRHVSLTILLVAVAVGCGEKGSEAVSDELGTVESALSADRSLAVTEYYILQGFPLERVLKQLGSQSTPNRTALWLFQQFWDTQETQSNSVYPGYASCDDQQTPSGYDGLNDFPWDCPRDEAYQAQIDPFYPPDDPLYIPIGLFNRLDLAPANGSHCGEYRIVYAMNPKHKLAYGNRQNYIIFEAVLPNPDPAQGLASCYPVAKMWYDLSDPSMSDSTRRKYLETFYFKGMYGFDPVVHINHYGVMLGAEGYGCSTGQIRTNQFVGKYWTMREYKLAQDCRCGTCEVMSVPMTVKNNPYGDLFNVNSSEPLVGDLENALINQLGSLTDPDINAFNWNVDDKMNAAESPIDRPDLINDYVYQYENPLNAGLESNLASQLSAIGSTLDPVHVIRRAMALSCAGCHHLNNPELGENADLGDGMWWPSSLGFVHVSEDMIGSRYRISEALEKVFLPAREKVLVNFLKSKGQVFPSGSKCEMELPPGLQMDEKACEEIKEIPSKRIFTSDELRKLREEFEKLNEKEGVVLLAPPRGH